MKDEYDADELPNYAILSTEIRHDLDRIINLTLDEEFQLYTQVDADGETVFLKGLHSVNRTGVYAWLGRTKKVQAATIRRRNRDEREMRAVRKAIRRENAK
jgi:hypothetical protein